MPCPTIAQCRMDIIFENSINKKPILENFEKGGKGDRTTTNKGLQLLVEYDLVKNLPLKTC